MAGCRTVLSGAYRYVEIEVLTAVVIKSFIFWDVTLCSRLKRRQSLLYVCLCWFLTLIALQP
jgi:hypothetical protein